MTSSGIFVTDRSSHQRYSIKELFLKIWQYSQKNHLCSIVFLIKLLAVFSRIPRYFVSLRIQSKCGKMRPATLLKRLSNKGVFLWILANFLKHLFLRTRVASVRIYIRYYNALCIFREHVFVCFIMAPL